MSAKELVILPHTFMDIALIVIAVVLSVLVLVVNIYILIHFQHPDDRNQAWFPKIVVVSAYLPAWNESNIPCSAPSSNSFPAGHWTLAITIGRSHAPSRRGKQRIVQSRHTEWHLFCYFANANSVVHCLDHFRDLCFHHHTLCHILL